MGEHQELSQNLQQSLTMFHLEDDDMELAKENFMSIMEAVWPTVASHYFEVEKEILSSIRNIGSNLQSRPKMHRKRSQQIQVELLKDPTGKIEATETSGSRGSVRSPGARTSSRRIVQIEGENGKITWDVIDSSVQDHHGNHDTAQSEKSVMQLKKSEPILVAKDPRSIFLNETKEIPADLRQIITDAESRTREVLGLCFSKISKSITSSYPRIRLAISKAYPQLRHAVSCSYPNIQSTINNAYDKVQATAKSSYPKIRRTVGYSYPKRQTVTLCYRRYRQHKNGGRIDAILGMKLFNDANQDMGNQLAEANKEIFKALHNVSKKISVALGGANLEVLQSVKSASSRVSKALVKANSEILEALASANDDLRKSVALAYNEASRGLDAIKTDLTDQLHDFPPIVPRTILHSFRNLLATLAECHVELLETLAKAGSEVCEQITFAHSKYSEAKVNVNYDISLALAKANSQVLQLLIAANSKVGETLERSCDRFRVSISAFKPGSNPEFMENKVWRLLERNEGEVWRAAETASSTIESAIENTDGRLWKIADEADNNLKKTVNVVEQKLLTIIASSEWKLKSSAEQLEHQVMECVVRLRETSWHILGEYADESVQTDCSSKLFHRSRKCAAFELSLYELHRSASIEVILRYNNDYFVGFPESEEDEDMRSNKRSFKSSKTSAQPTTIYSSGDSIDTKDSQYVNDVKVEEISSEETLQLSRCSACTNLASSLHEIPEIPSEYIMEEDFNIENESLTAIQNRPSDSNMTEPFVDDRTGESSFEDHDDIQEEDRLSEISDFVLHSSNLSLPDFGNPSNDTTSAGDSSLGEPVRKKKRYSSDLDGTILRSLRESLVKSAEEIFIGLSAEASEGSSLHCTSSGYDICRDIVEEEVEGTLNLERHCHGIAEVDCPEEALQDHFQPGEDDNRGGEDPTSSIEHGQDGDSEKFGDEKPEICFEAQGDNDLQCRECTHITARTDDRAEKNTNRIILPGVSTTPTRAPNEFLSIEELTAKFKKNLHKLQVTLSSTSVDSTSDVNSNEALRMLQECQSAWNALAVLHSAAGLNVPQVSEVEAPPPMEPAVTAEEPYRKSSRGSDSTQHPPKEHVLESPVKIEKLSNIAPTSCLWDYDDVFSSIHWEIIESITGYEYDRSGDVDTESILEGACKLQVPTPSLQEPQPSDPCVLRTQNSLVPLVQPIESHDDQTSSMTDSQVLMAVKEASYDDSGRDNTQLIETAPDELQNIDESIHIPPPPSPNLLFDPLPRTNVPPEYDQRALNVSSSTTHNATESSVYLQRSKILSRAKKLAKQLHHRLFSRRGTGSLISTIKKLIPCLQVRHKYYSKTKLKSLTKLSSKLRRGARKTLSSS